MMNTKILFFLLAFITASSANAAHERTYTFGVANQRSVLLTAQYWNPILKYVSEKSGVPLELKLSKTAQESSQQAGKGEYDFIYSNHIFTPENEQAGYRVLARPAASRIRGQIVTLEDSPVKSIQQLNGKSIGFPSNAAFAGYYLPVRALQQARVIYTPTYAGNQEGVMAQLKAGRIIAAGVNSEVMSDFAEKENIKYRILWESETYHNLPIAFRPSIPIEIAQAVRDAFIKMADDPTGYKTLADSAQLVNEGPPYGFVYASDKDYENYRQFYKSALLYPK